MVIVKKKQATSYRHYVTIQTLVRTSDNMGGFTKAWTDSATVAASINPIQARQVMEYKSIDVDVTHLVRMCGEIAITVNDRIVFGSRVFQILAIENIEERNIEKVITCKELQK